MLTTLRILERFTEETIFRILISLKEKPPTESTRLSARFIVEDPIAALDHMCEVYFQVKYPFKMIRVQHGIDSEASRDFELYGDQDRLTFDYKPCAYSIAKWLEEIHEYESHNG